jgi:hypothetical protein
MGRSLEEVDMSCTNILAATVLVAATATVASAEWRWVDEAPQGETYSETYLDESPRGPDYYQNQPRTVVRETYTPVVVTDREVFRDRNCDVTRTWYSDGTSNDERVCTRLVLPHVFIIDRIGRRLDQLRGYGY